MSYQQDAEPLLGTVTVEKSKAVKIAFVVALMVVSLALGYHLASGPVSPHQPIQPLSVAAVDTYPPYVEEEDESGDNSTFGQLLHLDQADLIRRR